MSTAMAVMVTDTMLTTAPPASIPVLRRSLPQWSPARKVSFNTRPKKNWRPSALRVSCSDDDDDAATPEERIDGDDGCSSTTGRSFGEVYVASVPLRAPKGVANFFDATKDLELFSNIQHYMTVIKPNDNNGNPAPCTVLDFQPQNPEDPMTVVAVLMGKSIPGVILERTLSRVPNQRCWSVGAMKPGLSLDDAVAFSRRSSSELSLGINDCRHHTLDLVEYLTGKSMSFIEEVRKIVEPVNEIKDELENSLEESPNQESIETSVKAVSSVKERVFYVPGLKMNLSLVKFLCCREHLLSTLLNWHEQARILQI